MADATESSLETLAHGVGERLDVVDASRARMLVAAQLFPRRAERVQVGRYQLRRILGAGGMGVVYAALDPQLDREVAIKMLRPAGTLLSTDTLVKEAKALARVAHPNVVSLFDVGTEDGQLFFVMELVHGQTLDRWCAATRERADDQARRWVPQVLSAFVDAGRGLAAVHDAGLVHLDFKPANVLAGDDGRIRVTDFGVVRIADARTHAERHADTDDGEDPPLRATSTRLGGTPAYMSPEQFLGTRVDLRSDVFGYCVALYEALFGVSPYPGATVAARMQSFANGGLQVPRRRGVPRRVTAALQRGLAIDPTARWPSMAALLAELSPRARPRIVVAAAFGLALGSVALLRGGDDAPAPCGQAATLASAAWSPARAQAIRDGFVATGLPYAAQAASSTVAALQYDVDAWIAGHTEACEATRVHGYQSDAVLAQRMQCLDAHLIEVDALVGVLVDADPEFIARASEAAHQLPSVDACADPDALAQTVELPADPRLRERAVALQHALAEARAHAGVEGSSAALGAGEQNLQTARELDHPPLLLEALVDAAARRCYVGKADACEAAAREALALLRSVRNDRLEAHAWTALVQALVWRVDSRRAIDLLPAFDIAAARSNDPGAVIRAEVLGAEPFVELAEFDAANARLEAAAALLREHPDAGELVFLLSSRARAAERSGALDEARRLRSIAALATVTAHGVDHPMTATMFSRLAIAEQVLGHPERALEHLQLALRVQEELGADDSVAIAQTRHSLGVVLRQTDRTAEAREQLLLAEAVYRREFGEGLATAITGLVLAGVDRQQGALTQAEQRALGVLDLVTSLSGADEPRVAATLEELGQIALARNDWTDAARRFTQALAVRERAKTTEVDASLLGLGKAQAKLGEAATARALLERVVQRAIDVGEPWRGVRLDAEIALAHLDAEAGDREQARTRLQTVAHEAEQLGRAEFERLAADALVAIHAAG